MSYCPRCGSEVDEEARFCPSCGVDLKAESFQYRRSRRGWDAAKVLMVLFGVMIILVSFGLMTAGGGLLSIEGTFTDTEGYLISRTVTFETDYYALVSPSVPIDLDIPNSWLIPQVDDWLSVKVLATSNKFGKPLFIAIADSSELDDYLVGVAYTTITNVRYSYDPNDEMDPDILYSHHPGGAPSKPPTGVFFWDVTESGLGVQELSWSLINGEYVLVGMNADGTPGVNVDVQFGVKLPVIIKNIGYVLMAGGFILFIIGVFVINSARR